MKAYELLSDESKWARRSYAYAEDGSPCDPRWKGACSWCVLGALEKCYSDPADICGGREYIQQVGKLRDVVGNISQWNDSRLTTYENVVETLRRLDI